MEGRKKRGEDTRNTTNILGVPLISQAFYWVLAPCAISTEHLFFQVYILKLLTFEFFRPIGFPKATWLVEGRTGFWILLNPYFWRYASLSLLSLLFGWQDLFYLHLTYQFF